jgi:hypothetical protein
MTPIAKRIIETQELVHIAKAEELQAVRVAERLGS